MKLEVTKRACPFCGEQTAVVKHSIRWGYFVSCGCTAVGPGRDSRAGAIRAWNTRTEPAQGVLELQQQPDISLSDEPDGEYEQKMDALLCTLTNGKFSKTRSYSLEFMEGCVRAEFEDSMDAGTIDKPAERIEILASLAREYLHRFGMLMSLSGDDVTDEVMAMEKVISEVCGRKVVDE